MSSLYFWTIFFALLGLLQFGTCASIIIYGQNMSDVTEEELYTADRILQSAQYDRNKDNFVFIAGFNHSKTEDYVVKVIKAIISLGEHNCIVLNWEKEAAAFIPTNTFLDPLVVRPVSYIKAVAGATEVGTLWGLACARMKNLGFDISRTVFAAFSLGCPLCGQAARTYKNVTGGDSFNKVHCLDAANPLYYSPAIFPPITKEDVKTLTCWITDYGVFYTVYGSNKTDCHYNARFNPVPFSQPEKDKQVQPGCNDSLCNHFRAVYYFVEAILNCGIMVAALADSVYDWIRQDNCTTLLKLCLHIETTVSTGVFYLNTTASSPYGLGLDGACSP